MSGLVGLALSGRADDPWRCSGCWCSWSRSWCTPSRSTTSPTSRGPGEPVRGPSAPARDRVGGGSRGAPAGRRRGAVALPPGPPRGGALPGHLAGIALAAAYSLPPVRFARRGVVAPLVLPALFVGLPFVSGCSPGGSCGRGPGAAGRAVRRVRGQDRAEGLPGRGRGCVVREADLPGAARPGGDLCLQRRGLAGRHRGAGGSASPGAGPAYAGCAGAGSRWPPGPAASAVPTRSGAGRRSGSSRPSRSWAGPAWWRCSRRSGPPGGRRGGDGVAGTGLLGLLLAREMLRHGPVLARGPPRRPRAGRPAPCGAPAGDRAGAASVAVGDRLPRRASGRRGPPRPAAAPPQNRGPTPGRGRRWWRRR